MKGGLVNLHDIPDEEFKTRIWSGLLEFFLKHTHEKQLLKRWKEIADILPEIAKITLGYDYIAVILRYTLTSIDKNDRMELEKILIDTLNTEKGGELMTSLAQSWKEEGIAIGKQDGIKLGEARGKAEGATSKAIQIAQNLLRAGIASHLIAESTGLSIEVIEKLKF